MHFIQDGNIYGLSHLTREDLQRVYDIYGVPLEYVHGKMTAQSTGRMPVDPTAIMQVKLQVLYTDMMHIDGNKFLVSVVEFLQLIIQARLQNENATQLGLGIQGHLSVKELYWSVKAGLPWTLPPSFIPSLVTYAVSCPNLRRTSALSGHMSP
jgi:hypothetical protein